MKKLFLIGAIAVTAVSANANYLYWQISSDDPGMDGVQAWAESAGTGTGTDLDNWKTATITIKDSDKNEVTGSLYNLNYNTTGANTTVKEINLEGLNGTTSGYSYYIELVNASNISYGSQFGTYADMETKVYTTPLEIGSIAQANVWHGSAAGYVASPEPTSAMLMLLGVAGLALRRKQRKA